MVVHYSKSPNVSLQLLNFIGKGNKQNYQSVLNRSNTSEVDPDIRACILRNSKS